MIFGHSLADQAGTLLAVDSQICEIMQRDQRELIGVAFEALTHPDDCTRNVTAVSSLRAGDGPLTIRKRYVRPDGSVVWSNVQVSRLQGSDGGRLVGTIQLVGVQGPKRGPEGLWRSARRVIATIQRRRRELGDDLFADHGWLILVQIYLAEAEGRMATVAAISDAAAVEAPVITRCLELLEQKMLVEHTGQPALFLQLTASGIRKVESLLDRHFGY